MTSLLPDPSHCTSDLGRLLFHSKSEWSGRAEVIDCHECTQMGVKFMEYTCLLTMTPRAFDERERTFVLSTRYKTLSKLHGQLRKLHQQASPSLPLSHRRLQLYLKSSFPPFPESKWIGGNDAATVADRKAGTEQLLSFLLDQEVLRKSRLLHQFVESAEEKSPEGVLVTPSSILTASLLDSPILDDDVPAIPPDNEEDEDAFRFYDVVSIETGEEMGTRQKGFLRGAFSRLRRTNGEWTAPMEIRGGIAEGKGEDYLVHAGHLVSHAQLAEAEGAFDEAFNGYKDAASVLLKGMEGEKSMATRSSLRLKTAAYLEKADAIYRQHLRFDNSALADLGRGVRPEQSEVAFRSSTSDLAAFRFVGVLPDVEAGKRVFLVEEKGGGRQFVMKMLERRTEGGEDRVFLPTNVPHMVSLVKFFSTQSYIILLLEYVRTGRLWNFLWRYLADVERSYERREKAEADEEFIEPTLNHNTENPYRGRHTRFSVSADCDRLATLENEALEDSSDGAVVYSVGEDVAREGEEGETAKYLLLPSDTASFNQGVEEAPAPVSLSSFPSPLPTGNIKAESSLTLSAAIAACRSLLKEKQLWPGPLPESLIIHWTAQCLSMLYVLHSHGVIIGDFHPDNLLVDGEGNVVFTYQARWQKEKGDERRSFRAGYAAPESLLLSRDLSPVADVWSVGALLFELLVGRPLALAAPHGVGCVSELPMISSPSIRVSLTARDLLGRMLQEDPRERISIDQIRSHPFYSSINWMLYDNPHGPGRREEKQTEKEEETPSISQVGVEVEGADRDEGTSETHGEGEEESNSSISTAEIRTPGIVPGIENRIDSHTG